MTDTNVFLGFFFCKHSGKEATGTNATFAKNGGSNIALLKEVSNLPFETTYSLFDVMSKFKVMVSAAKHYNKPELTTSLSDFYWV